MNNAEIVSKMTLEEKCYILSGKDFWQTHSVKRLGVESVMLSDGPHGVRKQEGAGDQLGLNGSVPATCFPTAATMANSWDPALGEAMGKLLGEEAACQDVSVLLGPGLTGEGRTYRSMDDIVLDLLNHRRPGAQEEARFLSLLDWGREDRLVLVRLAAQQEGAGVMQEHVLHSDLFQAFPTGYVLFSDHQQCVLLNLSRDPVSMPMLRHALAPLCRDYCLYAGISSPVRGPGELYIADRQARAALDRTFQLRSEKWMLTFSDCALQYMLSRTQTDMEPRSLAAPELLELIDYDRENDTRYFETLRTYLIEERDIPRTAQALIIHRTTLQYRLRKMQSIVSLDLEDPWKRLYLLMSLWILDGEGRG